MQYDLIIVGGGAAGYFCASNIDGDKIKTIAILEKGKEVLSKVKVSGGGRCNVTHACFQNKQLIKNYPRGRSFLRKSFEVFNCENTIEWFQKKGVHLKTEDDGRMFPQSNSSQTIIDCLKSSIPKQTQVHYSSDIVSIKNNEHGFGLRSKIGVEFRAKRLLVATGSNQRIWKMLLELGHTISSPVPSLFTFHIDDDRINGLQGLSVENAMTSISGAKIKSSGPLLITHWGQSGPAILKLSAFGARVLADVNYKFEIEVNWTGLKQKEVLAQLGEFKKTLANKFVLKHAQFGLPSRLWERLLDAAGIREHFNFQDLNEKNLLRVAAQLCTSRFKVVKKSTFKEEFVTAGGVSLEEIDNMTFESKLVKNLYFAGETLNIDAVTGGFNFQAAWTGAYIVAQQINKA